MTEILKKKDDSVLSLRKYTGKQLVSFLRQGDFAHAGEEKAIDLVMEKFRKDTGQQILDAGCGLGGTASYIQKQGWGTVSGIDIEGESIKYATQHYPSIKFHTADVAHTDELFANSTFDIICLFNSFYAFNDQHTALLALSKIAKTASDLVIFDYSIMSLTENNPFYRDSSENQTPFKPVIINSCEHLLKSTQWKLNTLIDVTENYLHWYEELINKLKSHKNNITTQFGKNAYAGAYTTYSEIYNALAKKELGGIIIYAEKLS